MEGICQCSTHEDGDHQGYLSPCVADNISKIATCTVAQNVYNINKHRNTEVLVMCFEGVNF